MDRKSMEASFVVAQITDQHFEDGFFSDEVRAKYSEIQKLDDNEKKSFFADSFNQAHDLASVLITSDRFNDGQLDLSNEGIGTITIEFHSLTADELREDGSDESRAGYRMLTVRVDSFDPQSDSYTEYDPNDIYGSGNPHIAYYKQHPRYWNDGPSTALDDNGDVADDFVDLDTYILLVLDQLETLEIANSILNQK